MQQNKDSHLKQKSTVEIEKLKLAATHDKEMAVAMLGNQARLSYTQSMGQNRTNLPETEHSLGYKSETAVASVNRLHSEELNKVVADYTRQLAAMDHGAREKGRQHDSQVAEYKRKVYLTNNTVGDELAEKRLLTQDERANELRSMREPRDVTTHDAIKNNASMGAGHKEEKQRMQAHLAQLSRNTQEEKRIATARTNAKLHLRDSGVFSLQEIRDKYDKMMRESPAFQQPSEPVMSPVRKPVGIPLAGAQPVGINRFKKPPNSSDPDPPASDSGPSEGRRRWGGPPGGPDPDPQDPPGRAPDRNTDSKKPKASNIILPALPSPPGFHGGRQYVRDAVTSSYEYNPDAAHTWIAAVEKPTATFDLMSMREPHVAALDANLIEAYNTLPNRRNDDLARQMINMKETAVKKEAGRLKGWQLLWTVYEYYKGDPKSAVLFKMIDLVKTKLHGDKLAELLATWDNVMIHIDGSIVDTDLKGSIFERQMEKSAERMYQRAPEGHENRTYEFLLDSAKLSVNTERYKTNRDRRQTTEYDNRI